MKKWITGLSAVLFLTGCQEYNATKEPQPKQETQEGTKTEQQPAGPQLESVYFNNIKEVGGKPTIMNPNNIMALVNKEFALPGDYVPKDLVRPKVEFSFGDQDIEKSYLRKEAAEALERMFQVAKQDGIHLFAVSGYRSYERQVTILENEIAESGEEKAVQAVAPPGQSEHQTGLSMDISAESVQFDLVQEFETTKEGQWLAEHAHLFGFILRYPKGKEDITGYMYEPWHFRYVGEKAAHEIYKNGWTLEEYFNHVQKI
ncbi:MAG TPA: M15 family metallopeptidase [Chondromyces sp.]|nr:M15 family metallopeptidase [Chondromyces sp.]